MRWSCATSWAWALIGSLLCCTIAASQDERPRPTGAVELTVRSPDGRPLRNADVEIQPCGTRRFDRLAAVSTRTDDRGVARFSLPVGLNRVQVAARGGGFGGTGTFEVLEGATARPALPPLAPLDACGTVEGVVPGDMLKPETYVTLSASGQRDQRRAPCDASGRFVLKNVLPGFYRVRCWAAEEFLGLESHVSVRLGRRVTQAVFPRRQPATPSTAPVAKPEPKPKPAFQPVRQPSLEEPSRLAKGTVRDESGGAVERADVFVIGEIFGGLRSCEWIRSAKTDQEGGWAVSRGPTSLGVSSGTIVIHKAGHPYLAVPMGEPWYAEDPRAARSARPPRFDLALPSHSGSLEVTVFSGGKPLAGAAVRLRNEHVRRLYSRRYHARAHGADRDRVEKLLCPLALTDAQGKARFEDLPPGTYEITAAHSADDLRAVEEDLWYKDLERGYAVCRHVAVLAGRTRSYRLAVYRQPYAARVTLGQPDGNPWPKRHTYIDRKPISGYGGSINLHLDESGTGTRPLRLPGLWNVRSRYRDSPTPGFPVRETPYYEASGVVAASPLLSQSPAAVLTACRCNPGSLVVQLLDAAGRPARGHVLMDGDYWAPQVAASTDARGRVCLEGVQAGTHRIDACLAGAALARVGRQGDPMPEDKDLIGRAAVFKQTVETANDTETRVTLRPQPVGYVRGVLRPAEGRSTANCLVESVRYDYRKVRGFTTRYDKSTGQFLIGPIPEGTARLKVRCLTPGPGWEVYELREVEVRSDRVARLELNPPAAPLADQSIGRSSGGFFALFERNRRVRSIPARVYLADGKTPAAAVELAYFLPEHWYPVGRGATDASGRVYSEQRGISSRKPRRETPGSPAVPVVVAWQPGTCGATITPVNPNAADQELKIVLPPPIAVRGKVTVGGKSVLGWDNQFCVLAGYQGRGKIDDLLSVHVHAEADGSFELSGLTPGTYRVQAAMDGIWLSPSARLSVRPDAADLEPLVLDIGRPGAASILRLVDSQGRPLRRAEVAIDRPEGPMAGLHWPDRFTSDGAGVVQVPPMEAGTHTLRLPGSGQEHRLAIPPLGDGGARPVELRVLGG